MQNYSAWKKVRFNSNSAKLSFKPNLKWRELLNCCFSVTRCQKSQKKTGGRSNNANENPYRAEMKSTKKDTQTGKKKEKKAKKKNKSVASTAGDVDKVKKTKYVKNNSKTARLADSKKSKRKKIRHKSLIWCFTCFKYIWVEFSLICKEFLKFLQDLRNRGTSILVNSAAALSSVKCAIKAAMFIFLKNNLQNNDEFI